MPGLYNTEGFTTAKNILFILKLNCVFGTFYYDNILGTKMCIIFFVRFLISFFNKYNEKRMPMIYTYRYIPIK